MMIIDKNKLYEVYSISDDSFTVGKFIYRDDSIYVFKAFDELGREAGIYTFKKRYGKIIPFRYGILKENGSMHKVLGR
jgi:hypothetical protein